MLRFRFLPLLALALPILLSAQKKTPYQYFRAGSTEDVVTKTQAGFALMGGGTDLDEAFRWMCERAGGGDFLVLRATGDDDYNPYIQPLCKLNSVATLILPDREAANDPFVASTIAHADAIFIAGGDQANYIRYWTGTPVQAEINAAIRRGVPIGGTSAGLAVMGEWAYSAEGDKPKDPNLDGHTALMNPLGPRVTLVHGFLEIPVLKGIITDTHFARRDRMGRLLAFVIDVMQPEGKVEPPGAEPQIRGVGIEEKAAVLLEPDGRATVVGHGDAYLVDSKDMVAGLEKDSSLTLTGASVLKVAPGHTFNIKNWQGDGVSYSLSAKEGKIQSTQPGGGVY